MSEQSPTPLFDLGKVLAKAEAVKADDPAKDTSIEFTASVEPGAVKEAGVEVAHKHEGERFAWSAAGWVKQRFEKDGLSAGVKGKVEF